MNPQNDEFMNMNNINNINDKMFGKKEENVITQKAIRKKKFYINFFN